MKETLKIIKTNFIMLLGIGLSVYNLFNFNSSYYCGEGSLIPAGSLPLQFFDKYKCIQPTIYYYYDHNTLILLTIGTIFIVIGLINLKRKNGK